MSGLEDMMSNFIGGAAAWASIVEVMVCPKPGLVDPLDRGCHEDMDWTHFVVSSAALSRFWSKQALVGLRGIKETSAMEELRATGLLMEEAMFSATGGVNTHKGLIFALSIWAYAAGACVFRRDPLNVKAMGAISAELVDGLVDRELSRLPHRVGESSLRKSTKLSNGERLYLSHGVTGIRGEAEAGFPCVVNSVYPTIRRWLSLGASLNDAAIMGLLAAMATCEDSNVIHRGGYEFWQGPYRRAVLEAMENFDPLSRDYSPILKLHDALMERDVSPGGAADLLACGLFALMVTGQVDNKYNTTYTLRKHKMERR